MTLLKKLFFIVVTLFVVAFLFGTSLVVLATDPRPWIEENAAQQVADADSVSKLLPQIKSLVKQQHQAQTIQIDKQQLESLSGFAQRALPDLHGQVNLADGSALVSLSYKLPLSFDRYVNLAITVWQSKGLDVGSIKVGDIHIQGQWYITQLAKLIDWKLGKPVAQDSIAAIKKVGITPDIVIVQLAPVASVIAHLSNLPKGEETEQEALRRYRVATYMRVLHELPKPPSRRTSLHHYTQPVFTHAVKRSQNDAHIAAVENEAAILALATFIGSHHFGKFIGDIQPVAGQSAGPRRVVELTSRQDLCQHFVFSAGIKLLSEQGVTFAIGEFKELMDRANGGSGFSFADLAADMAGIQWAVKAIDPEYALSVQSTFSHATSESDFFPDISGLPEGLTKIEFEQNYVSVEDPAYIALVQEIDRRIQALY